MKNVWLVHGAITVEKESKNIKVLPSADTEMKVMGFGKICAILPIYNTRKEALADFPDAQVSKIFIDETDFNAGAK